MSGGVKGDEMFQEFLVVSYRNIISPITSQRNPAK
jgi:hypothetical protein